MKTTDIKILENAYTSAIELAESCTSDSLSDCRNIYHIVKYIRAAVRDFPNRSNSLEEMFDMLSMHAARLKRIAGGKISSHLIVSDSGEIFPLSITNPCSSLAHLIRRRLHKKDTENFLRLHKITDLFMHLFFEYSCNLSEESHEMQDDLLFTCLLMLEHYNAMLERAMTSEGIPYDKINV